MRSSLCDTAGGRHPYRYASDQRSSRPGDKFPTRHRYRRCGRAPASQSGRCHQRPGTGTDRARRIVDCTGFRFGGAARRRVAQSVRRVDQRPGVRRISGVPPTPYRALPIRLRARRRSRWNRCGNSDLGQRPGRRLRKCRQAVASRQHNSRRLGHGGRGGGNCGQSARGEIQTDGGPADSLGHHGGRCQALMARCVVLGRRHARADRRGPWLDLG